MNKEDFRRLLWRQKEGKTSTEEDGLIQQIWTRIHDGQAPFGWEEEEEESVGKRIQEKIHSRIQVEEAVPTTVFWKLMKVAAAVLVFLIGGAGLWYLSSSDAPATPLIVKTTGAGQRAKITLPDGSTVQLNVNTTLTYPQEFGEGLRTVSLEGEAFFEVERDTVRPFLVRSEGLETKVLGTSFNVNAYNGKQEMVTVKSGKVQVSQHDLPDNRVLLLPDEAVVFDGATASLLKQPFDADKVIGWKSGKLDFDMVPFDDVVATLEQYYHTDIILKNYEDGSCMIKAAYQNNGLTFILSGLQLLVDFEYEKQADDSIVITYKSCRKS
ncbi:hypothetical protein DN752_05940 [Echinicola strongylocentroti]|uniref:Uncharacterized protein n=1 Tax=Echinicola strongylocentroti TaxID=1795355 RepID=A0A2Z4IG91_9BACT|nr:FecR domain-containing protein [Echinicola strongylocentroti]AWW29700.1 hypothetical protein DN752_05940 [Echinicola strongylocentroti]